MTRTLLALFAGALLFAACSDDSLTDEEIIAWATEYCGIHRQLGIELAALSESEDDPSVMVASERLARAQRIGGGSIDIYTAAAEDLRSLSSPGELDQAAEARARFYEAQASGWDTTLEMFADSASEPDFDLANNTLTTIREAASAAWDASLRDLDNPLAQFAARQGAECGPPEE